MICTLWSTIAHVSRVDLFPDLQNLVWASSCLAGRGISWSAWSVRSSSCFAGDYIFWSAWYMYQYDLLIAHVSRVDMISWSAWSILSAVAHVSRVDVYLDLHALYAVAHCGWEPCYLRDLHTGESHVSWDGFVLYRSCPTRHDVSLGSNSYTDPRCWIVSSFVLKW